MLSGAIVPRCAVQIRSPYSQEIARSKMQYLPNEMRHRRTFRGGRGRFPGIGRPSVHRMTSDRFAWPNKNMLSVRTHFFFAVRIFQIPRIYRKRCPDAKINYFQPSGTISDHKEASQPSGTASNLIRTQLPTFPCFHQKVHRTEKFQKTEKFQIENNAN